MRDDQRFAATHCRDAVEIEGCGSVRRRAAELEGLDFSKLAVAAHRKEVELGGPRVREPGAVRAQRDVVDERRPSGQLEGRLGGGLPGVVNVGLACCTAGHKEEVVADVGLHPDGCPAVRDVDE